MRLLKFTGHILIIVFLTILTQIGGLIWIIVIALSYRLKWKKRYSFPVIYLTCNLILIPIIAPLFGRVQLPIFNSNIRPQSYFFTLTFRNYVTPELKEHLLSAAEELGNNGIRIDYLEANFPFIDGYPLLPHLSHDDGKKIDIAFQYKTKKGEATNKKPSLLGYGYYANSQNPTSGYCNANGHWQYDLTRHLNVTIRDGMTIDKSNTRILIQTFLEQSKQNKIFLEPYLKKEMRFENNSQIRFHGCHAVRHDDHIHLQIK